MRSQARANAISAVDATIGSSFGMAISLPPLFVSLTRSTVHDELFVDGASDGVISNVRIPAA
jgi:hypothetical protein